MVMEAMPIMAMVAMDIQDTTEANDLLMPMLTMVMATVVDTDMVDTDMVDTEASAPLMPTPKLKPKPKLSHGMDMVTAHTHMLMVDTDTHMPMEVTITSERDLLMPNPTMAVMEVMDMEDTDTVVVTDTTVAKRGPLSHTMDMVVTMAGTDMAVDTVTDMADKKLISLHYLNFLN